MSTGSWSWLRWPQRLLNTRVQNCGAKTFLCPWHPTAFGMILPIMAPSYQLPWLPNSREYLPSPIFKRASFSLPLMEGLSESKGDVCKSKSRPVSARLTEVPRIWAPESRLLWRVPVLAILLPCQAVSLIGHLKYYCVNKIKLQRYKIGLDINIACLWNPFMEMSVWLSAAGKSSKFAIIDTSLEI